MSRGVYMDVHVPAAVTDGLLSRGIDVLTAQEDDAGELEDEDLLQRSSELGRILFTQDKDLLSIGSDWQHQSREFTEIVYAHQLALGIGEIIEQLELIAVCATDEEVFNRVIHLPVS